MASLYSDWTSTPVHIDGPTALDTLPGLENFVDALSSALVCWRFWPASPEILESREKRASIGIAGAFVVLSFVVGGVAISNLAQETAVENADTLIALASRVWFRSLQ